MILAIYSRKSRFTGKGDSIENQVQLCRDYAATHFNDAKDDILLYEDEGYSGGNTDRPRYQQMLKDARARKFDVILCYRLDRISRNVSDFSSLLDELQNYEISFVSIREQFDTSTPMGRAMMYIASVFAQLERETIAERIRDNMLELAKSGRWLGGITPTGYTSKEVLITDTDGKQRKLYRLDTIKDEVALIQTIYNKFVELKSLTKLETYCLQNDIKTKKYKDFSRLTLKKILLNPVYAIADDQVYKYFVEHNYYVYSNQEDFDGKHGIMAYNKTIQKKSTANKTRKSTEWVIAVGKHKGIIKSSDWIAAQTLLTQNKAKAFRKVKSSQALVSGLLRCAKCGSFMRPHSYARMNANGENSFYYVCELKHKSHSKLCDMNNANGNDADQLIIDEIKKLADNESDLSKKISEKRGKIIARQSDLNKEIKATENSISKNDLRIKNLTDSIAVANGSDAQKFIIDKINSLSETNSKLKKHLLNLNDVKLRNSLSAETVGIIDNMITNFSITVDSLDIDGKRSLLRSIVDKIVWDGMHADIYLFDKKK